MCVICVSGRGIRQPYKAELSTMFDRNPDGAGYMVARDGRVEIHKGFMVFEDFWRNIKAEKFTKDEVVIYHFRISTCVGVNPAMTHPFPLTKSNRFLKALDVFCNIGVAHNGIISLTSGVDNEYSDTAIFIRDIMTRLIVNEDDIHDPLILSAIGSMLGSKMVILDGDGNVEVIGKFFNEGGLLFSNLNHKTTTHYVNNGDWRNWRKLVNQR